MAQTRYAFDGDGAGVGKEDADGTVLYVGSTEAVIGAAGTATAEYFDDVSGTTLSSFYATRSVTVEAGLTRSFTDTPPLAGMGDAPWAVRWQLWLTVPVAGTYTFAVFADDGFSFNGNGLVFSNGTTRAATTTEASSGLVMMPGNVYNFALAYFNYTTATVGNIQLLWRRSGGALEVVPREAIHARGRKDYYSFGGAVVAMKEGVMSSATRTLTYLHGDHLGSVSLTTNASGQKVSEQRYKPYGEVRWASGAGMPTDFTFTGQRAGPANYVGSLTDYVARFYSPALGRFVSADTIVPGAGNPAAFNRYMYVLGNPTKLIDPSGHAQLCSGDMTRICPATGAVKEWEDWLRAAMSQSEIGRELLANDPGIFDSIIWNETPLHLEFGSSTEGQDRRGTIVHYVSLDWKTWALFKAKGDLNEDTTRFATAGHEVFHVYQRRRNPDREKVFTTIQMEREAYAAGFAMRRGTYNEFSIPGLAPIMAGPGEARASLEGAPLVGIAYRMAPNETRHNGNLGLAFTVDLGFSASAVSEIFSAAGMQMPKMPTQFNQAQPY